MNGKSSVFTFTVLDPTGKIIEQSDTLFKIRIESYSVADGPDDIPDSIFEPGQTILIRNIVVSSRGGLTIPAGIVLNIIQTEFFMPTSEGIVLPAIPSGQTYRVNGILTAKIFNFAPPRAPIMFSKGLSLATYGELIGRHMGGTSPLIEVTCRYPVIIKASKSPDVIAHGDHVTLSLDIQNVSSASYGVNEKTKIDVVVRVQEGIDVKGAEPTGSNNSVSELWFPVESFFPGEVRTISVSATMLPHVLHFDTKIWRAEIRLRNKPIQYTEKEIRCAPKFEEFPSIPKYDLILFTGNSFTMEDYLIWQQLALGLNLNIRVWDYHYYNGE